MKIFKILFLSTLILHSCKDKSDKKNHIIRSETIEVINKIDDKKEIENVAISFHKWYVKNTNYDPNDNSKKETTSFDIIKGENNKCKVDYTLYFKNLRKLGTISEKFLIKEKERTYECAKYLEKIDWDEFSSADAYEYEEFCGYLYLTYWTRSQENTENIEVSKIIKENQFWDVEILVDGRKANVKIEKESQNYMITQINWID